MAIELGRFLRPRPLAAAALIVVTAFGASVQMGLLVPHFGHPLTAALVNLFEADSVTNHCV